MTQIKDTLLLWVSSHFTPKSIRPKLFRPQVNSCQVDSPPNRFDPSRFAAKLIPKSVYILQKYKHIDIANYKLYFK